MKTIDDYGFPNNYDRTNRKDVWDFILNINKDKTGSVIKYFDRYFPELHQDILTWDFPDDFTFIQKLYHYMNNDRDLNLGKCVVCGKRCGFGNRINRTYHTHCSPKCTQSDKDVQKKIEQTCREKYGVGCVFQSEEIKDKIKETNIKNIGVDNPSKRPETREKAKQTCVKLYGVDNYSKTEECQKKIKDTNMKIYGVGCVFASDDIKDKIKETCQTKYGTDYYVQTNEFKEKSKMTCLDEFGTEHASQSETIKERVRQTNRERFGVEYASQTDEIKERIKNTNMKKYGVCCVFQSDEIKDKICQTVREKYNVDWYTQTDEYKEQSYQTKKKNGTVNSSKIENDLYKWFMDNNISIIRQYKSENYPFMCDFYLPDYDLYIEIQGTWTHGGHPYNERDKTDQKLLDMWKNKNTKYYDNAIETWTKRDTKKRKIAKENGLNFLEVFSCNLRECVNQINSFLNMDIDVPDVRYK